ncbi:hypothetical protein [Parachryseolinea silvisoli]|uniref:hypothetical protein n=1 Tax=Parachryseolinea silvisoli TaxID=2873601 RepID=UPI002265DB16|nr:hypothetical protein [Parachryseolinea silvisoli]MCD9014434.1 hypothetical protein [Parachryseolinea silvisoli]
MTISDKINILLLFATAIGVLAAFRQLYISNKQKRADLILQLYNQFTSDIDMQDIYYRIEYGQFEYVENTFHMSSDEKKLDKLIGLFSNIGQLYQMGIIKEADLNFIKYEFQVIYETKAVQEYFNTLDDWFQQRKISHLKFKPFREIGQKIVKDNYQP